MSVSNPPEDELEKILLSILFGTRRRFLYKGVTYGSDEDLPGADEAITKAKAAISVYTTNKIIEAKLGGLDKPSDTASVGGNQVADPILVSELFKMVYQWGRVGVVVDSSAPAFQEQLKEVIGSLK